MTMMVQDELGWYDNSFTVAIDADGRERATFSDGSYTFWIPKRP